jgi:4-hydroxybenzoate polyprenyltransferase
MSSAQSALQQPRQDVFSAWLTMARISNSPTVATNVLAGAAIAGALDLSAAVGLLVLAMVVFYTAGMLLNDVCDYGWDLTHRPDRPLVAGAVSRQAALLACIALFVLGAALLWLVGVSAFLAGLVLIGLIVLYDVWHKTNPFSPLVMAGCRLMVYVTAYVAFAWPPSPLLLIAGALLVLYMVGLNDLAKSEARPNVVGYWPAVLLFLPAVSFLVAPLFLDGLASVPLLVLANAFWVASTLRFVYRPSERNIGTAIARLIAGISLLDTLALAAMNAGGLWIAVALLGWALTLLLQRYVEGT